MSAIASAEFFPPPETKRSGHRRDRRGFALVRGARSSRLRRHRVHLFFGRSLLT